MKRLANTFLIPAALVAAVQVNTGRAACPPADEQAQFIRGDANNDGAVTLADPHAIILWLFRGNSVVTCMNASDANDDGEPNLTDAVSLANSVVDGVALAAPTINPGPDPTPNDENSSRRRGRSWRRQQRGDDHRGVLELELSRWFSWHHRHRGGPTRLLWPGFGPRRRPD